jgi:hypothetical protein
VVALHVAEVGRVARLEARPVEPPPTGVALAALADVELASAGDCRLALDATGLVASRTIVDPEASRLLAGAQEVAAAAAAGLVALRSQADADGAVRGMDAAQPPQVTPMPAAVEAYLGRFRTASAAQPAWLRADPAQPVHAQLTSGQLYEVLQEANGWAQVAGDDGLLWWTDGRTLRVPEGMAS